MLDPSSPPVERIMFKVTTSFSCPLHLEDPENLHDSLRIPLLPLLLYAVVSDIAVVLYRHAVFFACCDRRACPVRSLSSRRRLFRSIERCLRPPYLRRLANLHFCNGTPSPTGRVADLLVLHVGIHPVGPLVPLHKSLPRLCENGAPLVPVARLSFVLPGVRLAAGRPGFRFS